MSAHTEFCMRGEYAIRTGSNKERNVPPFALDGYVHREDGPCHLALFERAVEGVLPYPVPGSPWDGGYDMRMFQDVMRGGPTPGETFGRERFAVAATFGPRRDV